jgi:hypothetical protein
MLALALGHWQGAIRLDTVTRAILADRPATHQLASPAGVAEFTQSDASAEGLPLAGSRLQAPFTALAAILIVYTSLIIASLSHACVIFKLLLFKGYIKLYLGPKLGVVVQRIGKVAFPASSPRLHVHRRACGAGDRRRLGLDTGPRDARGQLGWIVEDAGLSRLLIATVSRFFMNLIAMLS